MKPGQTDIRDVAMILNPHLWPTWPILPVKRRGQSGGGLSVGVVLDDGKSTTVFHTNLFDLPKCEEDWAGCAKTIYASVAAMVADGWVVD